MVIYRSHTDAQINSKLAGETQLILSAFGVSVNVRVKARMRSSLEQIVN